jgi:hypothetical protein
LCSEANRHLALEEIDDYLEAREGSVDAALAELEKEPEGQMVCSPWNG